MISKMLMKKNLEMKVKVSLTENNVLKLRKKKTFFKKINNKGANKFIKRAGCYWWQVVSC